MVKKKILNKSEFFFIFSILIVVSILVFVFAAGGASFTSPTNYTNLSTTMNFSCSNLTVAAAVNATLYYNSTGGNASTVLDTLNITFFTIGAGFTNASLYVGHLPQSSYYNFTCVISNTSLQNESVSIHNVTIDYTPPAVVWESTASVIDGGAYSGSIVINTSVNDTIGTDPLMGVESVYFNITYTNGTQLNFTKASNDSNNYWNITLDTSGFPEARYNVTVYANDSQRYDGSTKTNSSEQINIYIDRSAPSAITLTKLNSTKTTLGITIAITDALSGIDSTCTVEPRTGTTVLGTTTSQTLSVTGLTCGSTTSYVVTCTDKAGNSASSSSYSFETDSCSTGVGSSGGGGSSWTGGTTYSVSDKQFEEGYTKQIAVKSRIKVKLGTTYHHIGVKELTGTSATIEIASDPVDISLDVGEDVKIDVTGDGFYDIYVILNSILNNKADITVQKIHEEIPEGEGPVATTGEEIIPEGEKIEEPEEKNLTWLWILIGILVLAAIIGGGVAVKKRRK